ncbi:hypothetical protein [Devosia sp.]|uniref:hypothetical protein n=1 Tax=Devosia sp. TaxID=1871048 RepID=UPI0025DDD881|nr:hypothetical protein [Devosia sp.]MCR6634750.1 hypothetical protein [Devosia sp.]
MKVGQRLLLTLLALLAFALASHQAMASAPLGEPCIQEHQLATDDAHTAIDIDHCVTCCQASQAVALFEDTLDFVASTLRVAAAVARNADIQLSLYDKLLRPPRFI